MDEFELRASSISEKIKSSSKILIVASKPVDYDSLGTTLAIRWWLTEQGKEVRSYIFAEIAEHIKHFPEIEKIEQKYLNEVDFNYYDLVILLDGNEFRQFFTNEYKKVLKDLNAEKIINIDHHLPGKIEETIGENCLRKIDTCTAKVFYDYFIRSSEINIPQEVAQHLYMALVGDTGVFLHGIYSDTFRFAQELIDAGANHDKAAELSIPKEMIDFTAWAIEKTKYYPEIKSTVLSIGKEEKKYLSERFGENWEKKDILRYYTNVFMRMVEGYPYSIILSTTADENNVRLIFRIKNYNADINLIEVLNEVGFGLKGHLKAGSGSITAAIEEAERKYIETMSKALETSP